MVGGWPVCLTLASGLGKHLGNAMRLVPYEY